MLVECVLVLLAYDWFFAVHSAFNRYHDSLAFQTCFHFLPPVVTLFQNTRRHSNPVVVEVVALRCLAVLRDLTGHRPLPLLPQKEGEEATVSDFALYSPSCSSSFCCVC